MEPRSTVGVRELRQNLSKYLERVRRGEMLEVTEHGQPVAVLGPLPAESGALARLVAQGKATRPVDDLMDLLPPKGRISTSVSDALAEARSERLL